MATAAPHEDRADYDRQNGDTSGDNRWTTDEAASGRQSTAGKEGRSCAARQHAEHGTQAEPPVMAGSTTVPRRPR